MQFSLPRTFHAVFLAGATSLTTAQTTPSGIGGYHCGVEFYLPDVEAP